MELQKLRVNEILYKRKINILDKKLELERHGHFVVYKVVREKLEARDKELKERQKVGGPQGQLGH